MSPDGGLLGRGADGPATSSARDRDRAVSAVVGKTLETGIVVLYVSMLVALLYGGAVPEYEAAAGDEVGERVLAESVLAVETAVPAHPRGTATATHDLPRTLDGEPYRIVAGNDSLRLVHDDRRIGGRVPLALPPDVVGVEGEWHSHTPSGIVVERTSDGRVVRLVEGSR